MQKQAKYIQMTSSAFDPTDNISIYWICNGGVLLNIKGTIVMIDPLLEGFDMPLFEEVPLKIEDVDHVDAILITHCDNDHFSKQTLLDLKNKCDMIHTTKYVASLCLELGLKATGHDIGDVFKVKDVEIEMTPADHAWQNENAKYSKIRHYMPEDYCGFLVKTTKGKIYMPGDSRLLSKQLEYEDVCVLLLDISDSHWHIGRQNLPILVNAYPKAVLLPIHWGCVQSDMKEFNGNPDILYDFVTDRKRIKILALGEKYEME